MKLTIAYAVGLLIMPACSEAIGCPVCDSGTGRQVRAGLFDEDFVRNLLATLLPFPFLLGAVAAIHYGWPGPRRQAPDAKENGPHDHE